MARVAAIVVAGALAATGCAKREADKSSAAEAASPSGRAADATSAEATPAPTTRPSDDPKQGAADGPGATSRSKGRATSGIAAGPDSPSPAPPSAAAATPSGGGGRRPIEAQGRFATTYRPGRGFLSGFEAALARGGLPGPAEELVADVGSLWAAELPLRTERAVTVRTDLERTKLPPTGGSFHVRIGLRSTPERGAARPKLAVHLVLDTSGSMKGEPMRRAREAAEALFDKLDPADDFSLTTFSTGAKVVVPVGPVEPRRALVHAAIRALKEGGNTDISAGLHMGSGAAGPGAERGEVVPLVLLVSDGKPTAGLREPRELSELSLRAFQAGVQTSSFGLGNAFDGPLMSAVAAEGSGAYYYLRDASEMRQALATEIDRRVDPVATALEVRVWLEQDVKLLHVYGSHRLDGDESDRVRRGEVAADRHAAQRDGIDRDRRDDVDGGMRFYIPTFARDDAHAILLELSAPGRRSAPLRVGVVEVKYKDRVFGKNVFDDATIWAPYGNTVAESSASLNRSVARTVHGFQAGEAFSAAAARMAQGDRRGAADLLTGAESRLRLAADALDERTFSDDADRLARLRATPALGSGSPLLVSMLLEHAGKNRLQ
ncbi:MAG: VWA domain-containing protein [Polyangiaceae bacterium]